MTPAATPNRPRSGVEVTAKPDPDKALAWWATWDELRSIERRRPAADALAEARDTNDC